MYTRVVELSYTSKQDGEEVRSTFRCCVTARNGQKIRDLATAEVGNFCPEAYDIAVDRVHRDDPTKSN